MIRISRLILALAAISFALTFGAQTIKAQDSNPNCPDLDPVCVDPDHYKVIYQNDDVRIVRYDDEAGYQGRPHTHAHPFQVYVMGPTSMRKFFLTDCKTKYPPPPPFPTTFKPDPNTPPASPVLHQPVTHCELNSGSVGAHFIVVEYLKLPPIHPAQVRRPAKVIRRTHR